jgi:transcriptional regulator with XRE-family HTH domain
MNKKTVLKTIESSKELGQLLKEIRKKQKITQRQLAEYANISVTSIGEIERGEVDVRFCHLLDLLKLQGAKLKIEFSSESS